MGVPAAGTYFVEVFDLSNAQVPQAYDLSVMWVDALEGGGCFPDGGQGGQGVNLAWNGLGDEEFSFTGSLCGGEERWFSFVSPHRDTGVWIELVVDGLLGGAVIEMYDELTVRNLGMPNFVSLPGVARADGTVALNLDVPRDDRSLPEGTWYIRIRGEGPDSVLDDYGVSILLLQRAGDCLNWDDAEPNEDPNEVTDAANLDLLRGISAGGLITRAAAQEVPLDLFLCPGEEDWFSFTTVEGDQIAVWGTSEAFDGDVEITLAGGDGNALGEAGALTEPGVPTAPARLNGALAGTHYVRVNGVGAADADPYTLFIHIDPAAMCGVDVAEVGPGRVRNDQAAEATPLVAVDADGLRWEADGALCDVDGRDRDWYRFRVPAGDTGVCLEAVFEGHAGEPRLSLFDGERDPLDAVPCVGDDFCSDPLVRASELCLQPQGVCGCRTDDDCDIDGDGLEPGDGFCVAQGCVSPAWRSDVGGGALSARQVPHAGEYRLLIEGAPDVQASYGLQVILKPPRAAGAPCLPDWRERPDGAPAELGSGAATVCDAWLCPADRDDSYAFEIPPDDQDRTIVLMVDDPARGEAELLLQVDGPEGPMFFERPFDVPRDPRGECVNLDAHALGGRVLVHVSGRAGLVGPDGAQLDYVLRIFPSDLDANPDGWCADFLGGPNRGWDMALPAP